MAGRILTDFWSPAQDDDGLADAGGSMTFRLATTTTLLDVYTDNTLEEAHPNPLVSDDAGRFPQIWAADAALYDIVCKLGTGVEVATLYNVGAVLNGGLAQASLVDAFVTPLGDETTAITASSTVPAFTMHMSFDWTCTEVMGELGVAQTSGNVVTYVVKVNGDGAGSGTSLLSTAVTIDNNEETSEGAGTPPVVDPAVRELDKGDRLDFYITQVGNGTAIGPKFHNIGYRRA